MFRIRFVLNIERDASMISDMNHLYVWSHFSIEWIHFWNNPPHN